MTILSSWKTTAQRVLQPYWIMIPFGMVMPGRNYTVAGGEEYRFGFNGKESDTETYGEGNIYDYGFRIYNARLGKFLSIDPLSKKFAWYSPYHFAGNSPIRNIDLDGLEEYSRVEYSYQGVVFLTITSRLSKDHRATVGDRDGAPTIDQGVYVKKIELTPAEFQAFNTESAENPEEYRANSEFSSKDIVLDPASILTSFEKTTLDANKNFKSGGGNAIVNTFTPQQVNLNFAPDDASASEVQNAYDTDQNFATRVEITVNLLVNFPNASLSIDGFTDADPTNYLTTDPNNPFFGTPGNNALSWDRANVLAQFIAQRAATATGQAVAGFSSRITPTGNGVARGAAPSDSKEAKATQRRFVMRLKAG